MKVKNRHSHSYPYNGSTINMFTAKYSPIVFPPPPKKKKILFMVQPYTSTTDNTVIFLNSCPSALINSTRELS
jgi:hypothetical protein